MKSFVNRNENACIAKANTLGYKGNDYDEAIDYITYHATPSERIEVDLHTSGSGSGNQYFNYGDYSVSGEIFQYGRAWQMADEGTQFKVGDSIDEDGNLVEFYIVKK